MTTFSVSRAAPTSSSPSWISRLLGLILATWNSLLLPKQTYVPAYSVAQEILASPLVPERTVSHTLDRAIAALNLGDELLAEEWMFALAQVFREEGRTRTRLRLEGFPA